MKRILSALILTIVCSVNLHAQNPEGKLFTSFDRTKIYYEVKGTGFPVILLHGFTGTSQGWKHGSLYPALIDAGYQVIILDQRGNGLSGKPHTDAGYSNDAEAKDVMALATSLGLKRYSVVGYSRGSIITSRLIVLDKRINKAVMGGMGADYTNPEWPRRIHAYKALMGDTTMHDVDEMMVWIHKNKFDNLALAYQQKNQPSTSPKELAAVKIPVLLIDGTEDTTNGDVTVLQKMILGSKFVTVPGNHNSAGNTIQFSAAILNFLK
ncbi:MULTISPECIES: alpha/beta hydrolase [unclassified Mucilaginibacter]|uniref:alpha/beta fold hydrolase n=1 Tax=unclassified Mucilaginibacter TaxID=2617802 RepID=UPI002AC9440E|nr:MULTISPECIES: alpha/beta hydrolase [unclassified Mucilaginibacter]MEB0249521.1 alpha/beta hydrolase [Mucilaginibacter sp. 5B2]MEB0264097.1 alpha/beta hydrolase [Mucilaginibacter sp. 10I4]MEB0277782.1 alpha/beta hydrolase [Mucilaginibacter sp. 10B2]MEB0301896.1 alpha/beta hydrolase [Mucilaginibacter sp. 5C4]WPX24594.1 alpha/beta hydrolase [Mucilaginibacter sp. 5C4]